MKLKEEIRDCLNGRLGIIDAGNGRKEFIPKVPGIGVEILNEGILRTVFFFLRIVLAGN